MYFKDKTKRLTVRVTEEQYDYVERISKALNCTQPQAFRFIIDTMRLGEKYNEDKQTDIDN